MPCLGIRSAKRVGASLCVTAGLIAGAGQAKAQSADIFFDFGVQTDAFQSLYLLVILNGRDTGVVAEFGLTVATGALSATSADLAAAGIIAPPEMGPEIALSAISGLKTVYDEAAQTISFTAPATMLITQQISARRHRAASVDAQPGWGLVLNHQVTVNLGDDILHDGVGADDMYARLGLRAYSPFGVFETTGAVGTKDAFGNVRLTRHETSFVHADEDRMMTLTLGDFSSAGLNWTRSVRMGGIQLRRDFTLNPAFLTEPSLSYSGVAVLPSGVDVFIGNVQAWSGKVDAGPFTLKDVPMVTPQGEAVFVLRDPGGQEQVSRVPFFATQDLLREGVVDYSVQVGRARENYGQDDFSYGKDIIGSASLRYGLTDGLTLSGHVEGAEGLIMLGAGIDATLFDRAELSFSGAQSQSDAGTGRMLAMALRTRVSTVDLRASQRLSFGEFDDLASHLTSERARLLGAATAFSSARLEQTVSLSIPLGVVNGYAGLSYVHSVREDFTASIIAASYSQTLGAGAAVLRVNRFKDLSDRNVWGVSLSLSFMFGGLPHGSVQLARTPSGLSRQVTVSRQAGRNAGDRGYELTRYEADASESTSLGLTYQGRYGRSGLALRTDGERLSARATTKGSVVVAGGSVFLTNRIVDGFAVVDVGAPDVQVSLNNRPVAITGWDGKALAPDLRSYQTNRISIEPLDLPMNLSVSATAINVVPRRLSGVTISFGGSADASALVVLRDAAGKFLPPGTPITLDDGEAAFPVGYDGEVWIEGLNATNRIVARTVGGECAATFPFVADESRQVYIEGVVCK
jgi:outer membrane usher protein